MHTYYTPIAHTVIITDTQSLLLRELEKEDKKKRVS